MTQAASQGLATLVNPVQIKLQRSDDDEPRLKVNTSTPVSRRGRVGATGFLSQEQIIDAAHKCFDENGYDGVTIRAIARQLNCAVGSIYRYFSDKRSLLLACAEDRMRGVLESLEKREIDLAESVEQYLEVVTGHRQLYLLWFWLEEKLPVMIREIIECWGHRIESRTEAEQYWSEVHGMILMNRSNWQILNTLEVPSPLSEVELNDVVSEDGEHLVIQGQPMDAVAKIAAGSISLPEKENKAVPVEPEITIIAEVEDVTLL